MLGNGQLNIWKCFDILLIVCWHLINCMSRKGILQLFFPPFSHFLWFLVSILPFSLFSAVFEFASLFAHILQLWNVEPWISFCTFFTSFCIRFTLWRATPCYQSPMCSELGFAQDKGLGKDIHCHFSEFPSCAKLTQITVQRNGPGKSISPCNLQSWEERATEEPE